MATPYDLFVIGGGINGVGIARDAAGRGLKVCLADMDDLGAATSSASTKLLHGGLRYLEFFEFGMVRHALAERETLLRIMPHIAWPLRFVLPLSRDMRFDATTPASRLLSGIMPWMRGRRPAWMIRMGLFLYDHLGGRRILPGTRRLRLTRAAAGAPLQDRFARAYEYSDCWVDDSRLVILNARDAADRGARILPRAKVTQAERRDDLWHITVETDNGPMVFVAKTLVNAAGPWVADILRTVVRRNATAALRLVRGSHILTKKLYDHDQCYTLQGADGRVVFVIPYETDFTLIGTTDVDHDGDVRDAVCTPEERDYLLRCVNAYFAKTLTEKDVLWTFSGVRPLYDDGATSATAATRDYVLELEAGDGPAVLTVFGGKITTYRKLAEDALKKLAPHVATMAPPWTATVPLPGGDFAVDAVDAQIRDLQRGYPFLTDAWARRLFRTYGTEAAQILGPAKSVADLGRYFAATLTQAEVSWLIDREYARTVEDIVWRRTKLGLRLTDVDIAEIELFLRQMPPRVAAE